MSSSIALIADIHGNRWALEAVLADIRSRGIDRISNLGDSLYGPLDPAGTADLLIELGLQTVRGNEDRILLEGSPEGMVGNGEEDENHTSLAFTLSCLTTDHHDWLASLPSSLVCTADGVDLFLCHGTPRRDDEYLLHAVTADGVVSRSTLELSSLIADIEPSCIACGHDHLPAERRIEQWLIVNPGSVGCPAFTDDKPHPHAIEAGSPHARYAVLTPSPTGLEVTHVQVLYDWNRSAQIARTNGRSDWALWLTTGRATS